MIKASDQVTKQAYSRMRLGASHLWAQHTAEEANMEATDQCKGNWLKVVVDASGRYTITNGRNGFSKSYMVR